MHWSKVQWCPLKVPIYQPLYGEFLVLTQWIMEPGGSIPNSQGSPIISTLSWISLIPRTDTYFFKVRSNIVLPSTPRPSKRYISFRFIYYGKTRPLELRMGKCASRYGDYLEIYWLSSRGKLTSSGPLACGFGTSLTNSHSKNTFVQKHHIRLRVLSKSKLEIWNYMWVIYIYCETASIMQ